MERTIIELKARAYGFISSEELDMVVVENRLHPCLVRCGGGRFVAPAQDVKHFIAIIERDTHDQSDYIRDISLQ